MSQQEVPQWDEIKKQLAAPFHSYYVGWKAQAKNARTPKMPNSNVECLDGLSSALGSSFTPFLFA